MESIVNDVIAQYGALGVLVLLAVYIIWDKIKSAKSSNNLDDKLSSIQTNVNDIRVDIPVMSKKIDLIEKEVLITNEKFDEKIDNVIKLLNSKVLTIRQGAEKLVKENALNLTEEEIDNVPDEYTEIEQFGDMIE